MAYHLPPIQPLWSFCSVASQRHINPDESVPVSLAAPLGGWTKGSDGRPRLKWAIARNKTADA